MGACAAATTVRAEEPSSTLIKNVQLFDGVSASRRPVNISLSGQRINIVSRDDIPVSRNAIIVDGGGHTLMPGLTDAHWHMAAVRGVHWMGPGGAVDIAKVFDDAKFQLQRGFTTVRDTAGSIFDVAKAFDLGLAPGPRCFPSGAPISQTSGHGDPEPIEDIPIALGGRPSKLSRLGKTAIANGVPEALAAARSQLKRGATQIKIMAGGGVTSDYDPIDTVQFTLPEMRAIVQAAQDWGTYVCAHAYTSQSVLRCLEAGVLSIEHGHAMDDRAAAAMAEAGAWLSTQPFETGDNFLTESQLSKAQQSLPGGWRPSVELAKKHGVKVAFGTDLFGRTRKSRTENTMLPRLGAVFSNGEVLRMATSGNAELFEKSGRRNPYWGAPLGVVKAGAWADLLLVRGNPLEDLRVLEDFENNLLVIIKDGVIHKDITPNRP